MMTVTITMRQALAYNYERMKSHSEVQRTILTRYFTYQVSQPFPAFSSRCPMLYALTACSSGVLHVADICYEARTDCISVRFACTGRLYGGLPCLKPLAIRWMEAKSPARPSAAIPPPRSPAFLRVRVCVQVANIYVTVASGSIISALQQILEDPKAVSLSFGILISLSTKAPTVVDASQSAKQRPFLRVRVSVRID